MTQPSPSDPPPRHDTAPRSPNPGTAGRPVLDIVIPVYNEQHTVARCVRMLHHHLHATGAPDFRITVADNASTDATLRVAHELESEFPEVLVLHLDQKGRGRALHAAWSTSDADVLCYMDVDLSTGLNALPPLLVPLLAAQADLSIGTRLAPGSTVVRSHRRTAISRAYNLLLKALLAARFSDAQCGFKAIRADAAAELLPLVQDTSWFFDTELLVLAQAAGLRIHEVAVDWVEDPDSRVDVVSTAADDLRGCLRVRRDLRRHRIPLEGIRERLGHSARSGTSFDAAPSPRSRRTTPTERFQGASR